MNDHESRARWLARWISMGIEAAEYLRDRGQESAGKNLEATVWKILDLGEAEVGKDVVRAALQEIDDRWCDGESLPEDFFAQELAAEDAPATFGRILH